MSISEAGDISTRAGKACNETYADGIGFGHEHNRHRPRHFLGSQGAAGGCRNHNIDLEVDELGCQRGESPDLAGRISLLEDEVLIFDVSKLPKPFLKGGNLSPGLLQFWRNKRQITYAPRPPRHLRRHRSWHSEEARQTQDEAPAVHQFG